MCVCTCPCVLPMLFTSDLNLAVNNKWKVHTKDKKWIINSHWNVSPLSEDHWPLWPSHRVNHFVTTKLRRDPVPSLSGLWDSNVPMRAQKDVFTIHDWQITTRWRTYISCIWIFPSYFNNMHIIIFISTSKVLYRLKWDELNWP